MTDEEREDLNTFRHDLVKQARWWQWKAETLEKENEQLKAENADLRERLEKAVELPCKVGDTIYSLDHFDLKIRENKVIAITFLLSNSVNHLEVQAHKFRGAVASFESIDFGKDVFTDRSAAEARLAELKGGEI